MSPMGLWQFTSLLGLHCTNVLTIDEVHPPSAVIGSRLLDIRLLSTFFDYPPPLSLRTLGVLQIGVNRTGTLRHVMSLTSPTNKICFSAVGCGTTDGRRPVMCLAPIHRRVCLVALLQQLAQPFFPDRHTKSRNSAFLGNKKTIGPCHTTC